jgi:hypothetical protein
MAVAIVSRSKGKIPRITFAAAQPINLTDDNWQTIEAAYGQSISQEIRTQINTATTQFLQLAVAEDTGLMNDAVQRANRLRRSAESLLAAIDQRDIGDVTRGYVDDELELSYRTLSRDKARFAHTYVDDFTVKLSWFLSACNLTAQRICDASQNNYWPDGGAWEVWVQHLTGIQFHGKPRLMVLFYFSRTASFNPPTAFCIRNRLVTVFGCRRICSTLRSIASAATKQKEVLLTSI